MVIQNKDVVNRCSHVKKKIQAQPSIGLFDLYPIILHWIEYYISPTFYRTLCLFILDLLIKIIPTYPNFTSLYGWKNKMHVLLNKVAPHTSALFLTDKDYFGHCVMLVIRFVVQTQANYLWLHNNLSN